MMQSLGARYQVALFGATGGVGTALLNALVNDAACARVFAGSRRPLQAASPKVTPFVFDLNQEASIAQAAQHMQQAAGTVDMVLVATGLLHGPLVKPEKTFRALDGAALAQWFAHNTIGPALIGKHMLPLLPTTTRGIFAALSAKVGSVSDNRLGGWHGYRASKAALNMIIKNFAIELARRHPLALCVALHPGTVDTQLSQPFQSSLRPGQLSAPAQAAHHLLTVLDQAPCEQSGELLAWNGQVIAP